MPEKFCFPEEERENDTQRLALLKKRELANLIANKASPPVLYLNDCIKVMKIIGKAKIDVVVTSPPYNLDIQYSKYKDHLSLTDYLKWIDKIFKNIEFVLKQNGSFFLNVGSSNKEPWIAMDVANRARKLFVLQNHFIWVKSHTTEYIDRGEVSFGHFKPINSKRFVNHNFEHVFHFTKHGDVEIDKLSLGVKYVDKSNVNRWNSGKDLRCRGNVWCIPYDTVMSKSEKGNHPAVFPERLAEWCIKLHGVKQGMYVFDPFLGTGTTLCAAKKLLVNGIGCDIDPEYLSFAKTKLGIFQLPL